MDSETDPKSSPAPRQGTDPSLLGLIQEALARLRFGSIQLTVHEGKLVQIDVTEKTRLPA